MGPVQPNPFDLVEPLAIGGMAEVWRGRHRRSARTVAIKVLTQSEARHPAALDAFRAEVRSAASLDHPQIAWVLDYGLLPAEWERRSAGRLAEGSPYLITEQARGGDLRRWVREPPTWAALRLALLQLLDALAFAHARGVVHRDLKPSNVLLGSRREERHGVLLSDFGIAHRLGGLPEPGFQPRAGTRTYMAPEQIAGDWRSYGPWTDLYALGVLTWAIAQGEAGGAQAGSADRFLEWHPPRFSAPPALAPWVARLLREDPAERFQRASDAAAALRDLGDVEAPAASWTISDGGFADPGELSVRTRTVVADVTMLHMLSTLSNVTMRTDPGDLLPLQHNIDPAPALVVKPPLDWRPARPVQPPMDLVDAGLGVYGLRERPIVGREQERDRLWALLTGSCERGHRGVALVSGPLGVGKSRLLRWLCERSDETGAALACFGRLGGDGGLATLLRRALRAEGLSGAALQEHLRHAPMGGVVWSVEERASLTHLLDDSDLSVARSSRTPGERYALVIELLRRLAGPRALVIALDDAHADPDGLGLARHLLQLPVDTVGPVVLLLAVPEDALVHAAPQSEGWSALEQHEELVRLPLGPLDPVEWPKLASAGLCLCTALTERVAARSGGNPLFAALLVEDWVRRDALAVSPAGFVLRPSASGTLPESVAALVAGQVAALESSRSEADIRALELAAVLALDLDTEEWMSAVALGDEPASADLLDFAMGRRLLRPGSAEGRLTFAQNMLREALLARAAEGGRSASHHRLAALAVAAGQPPSADRQGRLGRHRLNAGDLAGAVEPLLAAARASSLLARFAEERALLDLVDRALPGLPEDRVDSVCARAWVLRGHVAQGGLGDREEARGWLERAVAAARRAGEPVLLAEAQRRLGSVVLELGDLFGAIEQLRAAAALAEIAGDPLVHAINTLDLCTALRHAGRREEAEIFGRRSLQIATENQLEDMMAINGKHTWYLSTLAGPQERMAALRASISELARLRIPGHLGAALNGLALLEREHGDPEGADRTLRASLKVLEETGSSLASLPRYNIAHALLNDGQVWEAYPLLRRCLKDISAHRWTMLEPVVRAALAQIELQTGDLEAHDAHVARIRSLWMGGGTPEREAAKNLEDIAAAAVAIGELERARVVLVLAADLYEAARVPDEAARVREGVAGLGLPAP